MNFDVQKELHALDLRLRVEFAEKTHLSRFAAATLAHDYDGCVGAQAQKNGHQLQAVVERQLVARIRVVVELVGRVQAHHTAQAVYFFGAGKIVEIYKLNKAENQT